MAVAVTARLASSFGWASAFLVIAALAAIAGLLTLTIDASRRFYREEPAA
jgi:predicted MFS family arabinose efflux permease